MTAKLHANVFAVKTHTFTARRNNAGMNSFPDRILKLRKGRQLTQEQVAKAIGIKQGAYTQLETGKTRPKSSTLISLAQLFEVDPEWLMTGKGQQHPVASMTSEEAEFLLLFRSISPEGRQYSMTRLRSLHADEMKRPRPGTPPPRPDGAPSRANRPPSTKPGKNARLTRGKRCFAYVCNKIHANVLTL